MLLCSSWAGHSPPLWTHLLIHSSPDVFVFFLSLRYASFVLSLGPLHLQFPLSGKFFYQILAWLSPCHSDLRSVWSHKGLPDCPTLCDCITGRTNGHCLVNLRIYWLIVCFLPWHMSCKRTGITPWLIHCSVLRAEPVPGKCSLKKWSNLGSPSCHLCDLGQVSLFPLCYIRLQNLLVMKMNEMYIKCLAQCRVHRMCLIIRFFFFLKGLKHSVCICVCLWAHVVGAE